MGLLGLSYTRPAMGQINEGLMLGVRAAYLNDGDGRMNDDTKIKQSARWEWELQLKFKQIELSFLFWL